MTYEDLKTYVGAQSDSDAYVIACYADATALVEDFIGDAIVPASIKDRAILEVGSELFHRKNAPSGIAQYQGFDGQPVRIARDPMVGAYPLLSRYMVIGL